ncbi:MAG: murein biosynthesis integral membrane protein MurJ [Firmicutes bacterium HGW-Firmicutes-1]|jgi:putative peptidoglycan lipid II flippase|nr:MAG: murein biosynthesis integral membrane protein MurJ [Firmicutes bacterium HGW-Firmicutes-1]
MSTKRKDHAINIIMVIIGLTLFSKVIGFARDAVMGSIFGTGMESDAYLIGLGITTIIFLSLGTGIATSIIPISVKLEKSKDKNKVLSGIFNCVLLISGIITVLCFIFTPEILHVFAGGFEGEKLALTIKLTRIMIPTVFFIAVAYLYVGLLQAHEHYLLPAIISFPYNLIAIGYLIVGVNGYGIVGLAVATTIGWFLQMVIQIPKVHQVTGFKYSLQIDFKNSYVKEFLVGIVSISIIAATQQITYLSDNTMASHFGDGKVTTLYYSNMLFLAIVTTAVYGITSVMFPKFNKKFAELDKSAFFSAINSVLKGIILLLAPVSVGLALVSENAIGIILMRGEFTFEDVKMTSLLLIGYASYMIAFGIWDVLNKAFYTMGNKKVPMMISVIIIGSNYILNLLCVKKFGIVGIPIATSIAFYIGVCISCLFFKRSEGELDVIGMIIVGMKALISVFVMAITILGVNSIWNQAFQSTHILMKLVNVILDVGIGMAIYLLGLLILREKNILDFIHAFKMKKKKKGDHEYE